MRCGSKTFSRHVVSILLGEPATGEKADLPRGMQPIAEALDDPLRFPFLLARIVKAPKTGDVRLALHRVQVDCNLRGREDVERYNLRLYVARTIEVLLFGEPLLESGFERDEEDDD